MSAISERRSEIALAPYVLHLRPREWPIMAGHTLIGWWLAAGIAIPDTRAVVGIGAWVVALNGGTLALNSAFDRDTGDIAFLKNPPMPPSHLAGFALMLMALGLGITWYFPAPYRMAYVACVILSIAYSVPPIRLKAVAGADWVINMLGFGTLSPYAGWAITGRPLSADHAMLLWAFCPLFAALYPLTQLYQMDEDRARGDRTFALRLGVQRSLKLSLLCTGLAFGMLAMSAVQAGWSDHTWLRWGALGVALASWLVVLMPWYATGLRWSSAEQERGMYHALAAWALTDVAVILAWAA